MIPARYIEVVAALNPELFAAITPSQADAIRVASGSRAWQPYEVAPGVFVDAKATADIVDFIIADGDILLSGLDDGDLAEAAETGVYIPGLLDEIRRRAALLTDDELLSVEPFEGDDDVRVLSVKVVRGRREHRDFWSKMPIPAGEPHVVRKEVKYGEFLTTRHSRETLWMALAGGFGSQELAKQVSP